MYLARHEEPSLDLSGRNDRVYRGFYVRSVNHEIQFECFERETAPDTLLSLKLILPPPHLLISLTLLILKNPTFLTNFLFLSL